MTEEDGFVSKDVLDKVAGHDDEVVRDRVKYAAQFAEWTDPKRDPKDRAKVEKVLVENVVNAAKSGVSAEELKANLKKGKEDAADR